MKTYIRILTLLLGFIATPAIAQVVFDYNPPALGSSEAVKRNDLDAELDGISGKVIQSFCLALSDETTAITTTGIKATWHMPYAFTLTGVSTSVNTVSTSGLPSVQITEDPDAEGGTAAANILSTVVSIDANERRSSTATTAAVISDSSLAANSEMAANVTVTGTGAKGLKLCLIGTRT